MRRLVAALLFVPASAFAANFATCVIDGAKDVQNDMAARAVYMDCSNKYPGALDGVSQGSGRGWVGFNSGAECAAKHAAKTPSLLAGRFIFYACKKLYDAPVSLTYEEFLGLK